MTEMTAVDILRHVSGFCDSVLSIVDPDSTIIATARHRQTPQLVLQALDEGSLSSRLSAFHLHPSAEKHINALYRERCLTLRKETEKEWSLLSERLVDDGQVSRSSKPLQDVFQALFEKACTTFSDRIVSIIEKGKHNFAKQAEHSALSSESDSDDNIQRGHSLYAVTILEAAYSVAKNINRGEKLKLAKETGLEPRQVTIWFQNRRNRKPVTSKSEAASAAQQPLAATKRKYDGVDESPRLPSKRGRPSPEREGQCVSEQIWARFETPSAASLSSSFDTIASSLLDNTFTMRSLSGSSADSSVFTPHSAAAYAVSNASLSGAMNGQESLLPFFEQADDPSCQMMFDANGNLQLDLDDLQIDISALQADLTAMQTSAATFPAQPLAQLNSAGFVFEMQEEHDAAEQDGLEAAMRVAKELLSNEINAAEEVTRISEREGWLCPMDRVVQDTGSADDTLSLVELMSNSSPSTSSTRAITPVGGFTLPTKHDFDFSVSGLGIDHMIQQNFGTFGGHDDSGVFGVEECSDVFGAAFAPMQSSWSATPPDQQMDG